VIDETLVPVPGLFGSCTSHEALGAGAAIVAAFRPDAGAWRVGTEDGCDPAGRSVRWELRYDLGERRSELRLTIAFVRDEAAGVHTAALASVQLLPFPSEGSELAKMARAGLISGRRLRSVWRQQMREHEALPTDFPGSDVMARAVAPDEVRSAYARITRQRGAVWVVETPGRTRHLRRDDLGRDDLGRDDLGT
jgi:hypothetical protein